MTVEVSESTLGRFARTPMHLLPTNEEYLAAIINLSKSLRLVTVVIGAQDGGLMQQRYERLDLATNRWVHDQNLNYSPVRPLAKQNHTFGFFHRHHIRVY
ncbi:MAG: hypothetical protein M1484_03700 [Patescibacteria group bacterium]|nr:hypothetical protein [Patescibacteria group bacterium]MCL5432165.1 hypothetical protein [Patescibacteria group bacterium]